MPSQVFWYVENRILYTLNTGDLTPDDFRSMNQQISRFMRESSQRVHVIMDSTRALTLPGLNDIERGHILKYLGEPHCGWTVAVGKNIQLRMISTFISALFSARFHNAATLDEAMQFIRQIDIFDQDLPDFKTWLSTRGVKRA
jgi:hypothetical protein